jgi:hypothetical protein
MGGTPGTAANSPRGLTPLISAVALIFFLSNCEKRPPSPPHQKLVPNSFERNAAG